MTRTLCLAMALAALAGAPNRTAAQIESRCLPPEMPMALFPSWVAALPDLECREVSAPLLHDHIASRKVVVRDARATLGLTPLQEGKPDATTLADLCKEPRRVIRLAEERKFQEAAKAGDAVLKLPRQRYGDYTWDYVANATAWAHIQAGNLDGAIKAHHAGAGHVQDTAVAQYHRLAASALHNTVKSVRQLKDYATYRGEIRKQLEDTVARFERNVALAKKTRSAESRLRHMKAAYDDLRVVLAADPETGKRLQRSAFRETADGLVVDIAPVLLDKARAIRDRLVGLYTQSLPQHKWYLWNSDVAALWDNVRHIKRFCRMHAYLARIGLAGQSNAAARFREAHRLLFVPGEPDLVWQQMGHRPVYLKDIRRRVPYKQTKIRPM